ncbi:MAG: hypothetical protein LBJ89_01575, partial [Holosporales bacterium]|jgi:hypothetical protein|nr:hypothetical protein [Holosporales bacterium]
MLISALLLQSSTIEMASASECFQTEFPAPVKDGVLQFSSVNGQPTWYYLHWVQYQGISMGVCVLHEKPCKTFAESRRGPYCPLSNFGMNCIESMVVDSKVTVKNAIDPCSFLIFEKLRSITISGNFDGIIEPGENNILESLIINSGANFSGEILLDKCKKLETVQIDENSIAPGTTIKLPADFSYIQQKLGH